jgi:hypothetical protein
MPREMGLGGNLWDGKTLAAWIAQRYEIDLGVRQCQRLFRQLDSWIEIRKQKYYNKRGVTSGCS